MTIFLKGGDMYHLSDITNFDSIEDVFAEVLQLLQDNEPRQARDMLDTFTATDAGDFSRWVESDIDDKIIGPSITEHSLACTLADEAISLIDAGELLNAARRIECFCRPKWESRGQCQEALDVAMAPPAAFIPTAKAVCVQTSFNI